MFWNRFSPENALENMPPIPPALVSICMFGVIHTMDPPSVIICSPLASPHVTTGNVPPLISYLIVLFLFCHLFSVVAAVRGVCGTSLMDLQQTASAYRNSIITTIAILRTDYRTEWPCRLINVANVA